MLKDDLEIILITYNRRDKLSQTLAQIFSEESPIKNFNITVLDNKSTDGSSELIQEYTQKFPNMKHIIHPRNIGGNGNIARAYEIASQKYIWEICDDDDYDWSNWNEIETAINQDYDMIFTQTIPRPGNLSDIFHYATFVPGCIYKTENITSTVVNNMLDNILYFFPHLALAAKIINDNKKIFIPQKSVVTQNQIIKRNSKIYIRDLDEDLSIRRRYLFWFVGFLNSVQLIKDSKKRDFIINDLQKDGYNNLYDILKYKMEVNKKYYNNFFRNFADMFLSLNFHQRLLLLRAFLVVQAKYFFVKKFFEIPTTREEWLEYFEYINQKDKIKALAKKYKNKKIVIYGAGLLTDVLFETCNMSKLNIVAICDRRFKEKTTYHGIDAVSIDKIKNYNPDVIFISTYRTKEIINTLKANHIKTKIEHILKKSIFVTI